MNRVQPVRDGPGRIEMAGLSRGPPLRFELSLSLEIGLELSLAKLN
jgi:hypothetical protein